MHSLKDERYIRACNRRRLKKCTEDTCEGLCEHDLAKKGLSTQHVEILKERSSKGEPKNATAKGFTACDIEITAADLPLTISSPGNYCLAEDIIYSPPGMFLDAIFIESSDVVVDLKGYTLKQGDALGPGPLTTGASGTSIVTVTQMDHGFSVGDVISITGAIMVDGISPSDINKDHLVIDVVDVNKYKIDCSPSTAIVGGVSGGGSNIVVANNTFGVSGFFIVDFLDAPLKNIEIKNGYIQDFTGAGIWALSFSQFAGNGPYDSFTFHDLNIACGSEESGLPAGGINLDSFVEFADPSIPPDPSKPANVAFRNVSLYNCKVNRTVGSGAIRVWYGQNVTMERVEANNTIQTLPNIPDLFTGEFLDNTYAYTCVCNNLSMINCQGNNTRQEFDNPFGQAAGASIFDTIGAFIKDCQFNNTFSEGAVITQGGNLSNLRNAEVINCQFNNVSGGSTCFLLDNVHMSDDVDQTTNADSVKFVNCQFNGASVDTDTPPDYRIFVRGVFILTVKNISFENCQATNKIVNAPDYTAAGYAVSVFLGDPASVEFANLHNTTFRDCIASDIRSTGEAIGYTILLEETTRFGDQGISSNSVFDNCIAERIYSTVEDTTDFRIMGIGSSTFTGGDVDGQFVKGSNLFIRNCRVSDVRHLSENVSEVSSGILVEANESPVLCGNSVTDCDRGILFSGSNDIIPNAFQLATTKEDAEKLEFIDLGDIPLEVTGDITGDGSVGPFPALFTFFGPREAVSAPGEMTDPIDACGVLSNNLTNKVGVAQFVFGNCGSFDMIPNIEAANAVGSLLIDDLTPTIGFTGIVTQTNPAVSISQVDGNILRDAIENNAEVIVSWDTVPGLNSTHTFLNQNGTSVSVNPGAVNTTTNFISADPEDLNDLKWKVGDSILYTASDPTEPLPGLVSGETYYVIVYSPGFTDCGLVQENKVTSCSISGYQDNRCKTTSAFVTNTAFNNGKCNSDNYKIKWPGKAPVCKGDLACYPECPRPYNLSLTKARKHHSHKKCHCGKCHKRC